MKKIKSLLLATLVVCGLTVTAYASSNQLVEVNLWNANLDQPSMGNIATDNNPQALYNATKNTLTIGTNSVEVSGYMSGVIELLYDTNGNGNYKAVTTISTETIDSGTKYDGTNHEITYLSSFELELPTNLTKTGVEYFAIKMKVPYTPMDVAVGTGYLDARIKIDWTNSSNTTLEVLTPNTEMSSGDVVSFTLESNGIQVNTDSNVVSEVTKLNAEKITSGSDYTLAQNALSGENFTLYNLEFSLAETEVDPTGTVTIVFPYDNISALYRINADGSKTVLTGTQTSGAYTIMTRTVGLFAVVGGTEMSGISNFTDITGHWATDYISQAVSKGLFNGTSTTAFSPNSTMTNEMAITVLYRIAGEPSVSTTGTLWYSNAVQWGLNNGIIGGYNDFVIGQNVSREALATMIYKYELTKSSNLSGNDLSSYSDSSSISYWATEGLAWANAQGIVTGKTSTTIEPKASATRAEVATMFCRYIG